MEAAKKTMDTLRERDKAKEAEINLLKETLTSMGKELEELKLKHNNMMNEENIAEENLHTSDTAENKQFQCHCGYQASGKRAQ